MKRWWFGCLLLLFYTTGVSCVSNGRFEELRNQHLDLQRQVNSIRSKQIKMLAQLTRLQVRLQKLSQIFDQFEKKGQYNFANIGVKMDELRTHHQELLGKYQVLTLSYNKLEDQHKKLLEDYSRRFGSPLQSSTGGNQVTVQVISPEALFKSAKELYDQNKYVEAREQLKNMIKRYPDHELTDDAYVLIGSCYEKTNKVYEAILWYNDALKKFPKGNQLDHALFKLGTAHYQIGACPEGRAFLRKLRKKYPRSTYASQARDLINNIRQHCQKR